jgi:tyrosyl-tRNA synthetase
MIMTLLQELKLRGLIKDVGHEDVLETLLANKTTIYCGFDPSARSMHLGNFVPISILMRLQQAGHRIIAVVGGATGMIGDPSGKSKERQLLDEETLHANTEAIKQQLSRFLDLKDAAKGILVNNYDWLGSLSMIHYLRDYGKHFPMNMMLAKDVVANRLEQGLSYTEFSYMMLQAIDFAYLYKTESCQIQFGGSDQWGNLTAGLELIRRQHQSDVPATIFTTPLITRSDGKKFGKSEDGALFLDATLTSPYALYQYFYNVADDDAMTFLRIFSFLSLTQIEQVHADHLASLGQRLAQKVLAKEMVTLLHGEAAADEAIMMSEVLFKGTFDTLSASQLLTILGSLKFQASSSMQLEDVLLHIQAAKSKREAREFINGKSISLNGEVVTDCASTLAQVRKLHDRYVVLRRGKKLYYLIEVVD